MNIFHTWTVGELAYGNKNSVHHLDFETNRCMSVSHNNCNRSVQQFRPTWTGTIFDQSTDQPTNQPFLTSFLIPHANLRLRSDHRLRSDPQVLTMGMFFGSGPTPSPTSIPPGLPSLEAERRLTPPAATQTHTRRLGADMVFRWSL